MAVSLDVSGKVAIVTGAGRGIGQAIAVLLARAGADIICASRSEGEIAETAGMVQAEGRRALAIPTDVTKRESVQAMMDRATAEFGRVDILINNAGTNDRRPALAVTDEQFDRIMAVNVKGTFLCSQVVGRHMVERRAGRIVNIASMLGLVATETTVAYGASKAAVIQMTKVLALEWAQHGVFVNAVAPGGVHTKLVDHLMANPAFVSGFLAKTPMGRMGTPEELASVTLFLCSDAANYMTGSVVTVDGGYTIA